MQCKGARTFTVTKSKGASSVVWVTEYQYHERRIVQVKLMTVAGGLAVAGGLVVFAWLWLVVGADLL